MVLDLYGVKKTSKTNGERFRDVLSVNNLFVYGGTWTFNEKFLSKLLLSRNNKIYIWQSKIWKSINYYKYSHDKLYRKNEKVWILYVTKFIRQ